MGHERSQRHRNQKNKADESAIQVGLKGYSPKKLKRPPWQKRWKVFNDERRCRRLQVNGEDEVLVVANYGRWK